MENKNRKSSRIRIETVIMGIVKMLDSVNKNRKSSRIRIETKIILIHHLMRNINKNRKSSRIRIETHYIVFPFNLPLFIRIENPVE